jgi:hypothetical protein
VKLNDLLDHILQRVDMMPEGSNVFTADEVAGWPEGALDFFVNHRLLSPTTPANSLECDGCEERCFMQVFIPPADAPITKRPFIICNQRDDIGRVIIAPDRLKRWQVDLGRLAGVLSDLLGIDQTPHELICHRLWNLGKVDLESGMSEVFLARGLDWTDAEETLGNDLGLKEAVAPLVFTPGRTSRRFLPHASIFSVTREIGVQKGGLVLDRDGIARAIPAKSKPDTVTGNVFRKKGQYWTISFEGQNFPLKDSKGLQYLAFLLAHPGQNFHAYEILSGVDGEEPMPGHSVTNKMREQHFIEDGLKISSLGDAGPLLDNQAKKQYKKRLEELRKELEEAKEFSHIEQAERAQEEMEALEDALTAAFGLNGRARKGGDPNERARKTLSTAIRRTLVHIKKENIDLWRHLKDFLDLGLFSSYHPRPQVNWTT